MAAGVVYVDLDCRDGGVGGSSPRLRAWIRLDSVSGLFGQSSKSSGDNRALKTKERGT